ncbi:FAD-dependent monooxygenase, partial [Amycolatopsis sp. NPDC006131]|uniref:FAD-dependent oxidoreductase n=1 Tax=Amycolatopsis sp. NPDC006131 TaxID=3156731 RepID=UPI0033ABB28D
MDYDVLVVGAGPVGLMLATELGLAGIRVAVVERRSEPDTAPKAGGINTASAEIFERRGLLPAIEAARGPLPFQGERKRAIFAGHFGGIQVPAAAVDEQEPLLRGRGPGWYLPVEQVEVERVLGRRAAELGVEIRRGAEVTGFHADDDGVTVHLRVGGDLRAAWLVGCDGGRSLVRRQACFDFAGSDPT